MKPFGSRAEGWWINKNYQINKQNEHAKGILGDMELISTKMDLVHQLFCH
jgi:hypothetical protein